MKSVQIGDWDLEDRLSVDRGPVVVQFAKTGRRPSSLVVAPPAPEPRKLPG
jgi:hypothetical protein